MSERVADNVTPLRRDAHRTEPVYQIGEFVHYLLVSVRRRLGSRSARVPR